MTWGKEAAEAQEAIAQRELADLERGIVPDSWKVLGRLLWRMRRGVGLDLVNASMLDVGCGVASTPAFLRYFVGDWLADYFGIDSNRRAIAYARKREREVSATSLFNLNPDMREVFTVVLSNGTLNHLKDWPRALAIMSRLCAYWLVLHRLWVFHDDTPTVGVMEQAYGQDLWHLRINEAEMVELLDGLGFELLEKTSSDGSDDPMAGWTYVFERKHDNG